MRYLCECTSTSVACSKTIELSDAVAKDIQAKRLVIIVQGCPRGPETTDELVETRAGYSLYRDTGYSPYRAKDFV
jgi:malate/lactate dehydrogenase